MRELDGHDLVAAGAGCECLGGIGQDDDIAGAGAAFEDGAHLARGGVDDADRVATAVGDHEGLAVGRNARRGRLFAGADLRNFAASLQVEDRDAVRAGVGDVGEFAVGIECDRNADACAPEWWPRRNCSQH